MWYFHNESSMVLNHAGVSNHSSDEMMLVRSSALEHLPDGLVNDGAYTNVTASLTNQNYLMVPTVAPNLASGLNGINLVVSWAGIPGVTYQLLCSTNLVDWQSVGGALAGTNGPMQIVLPLDTAPAAFFRVSATH